MQKNVNKIIFWSLIVVLTALLVYSIRSLGNYWDWLFPYTKIGLDHIFTERYAWLTTNMGAPLGYSAVFYFGWFLLVLKSTFGFVGNQTLQIIVVGLALLSAAFFAYRILKPAVKNKMLQVLLASAVIFNPAIFYKLFAGHTAYLYSYALFVLLIGYLTVSLEKKLVHYLILGLLLGFVGFQIQFFVFALLVVLVYLLFFNRRVLKTAYLGLTFLIALLINLPWLSNFLVRANDVATVVEKAREASFSGAMFTNPLRVLTMTFSPATGIQYIYSKPALALFGLLGFLALGLFLYYLLFLRRRLKSKNISDLKVYDANIIFFGTMWILFSVLGTGFFQNIPIPLVQSIYPMFRESGHFAPLIVLFELLTIAYIVPYISLRKWQKTAYVAFWVIFIGINLYVFIGYLPRVNYKLAQSVFGKFEKFGQTDNSSYRILAYPFWNQYGFIDTPNKFRNDKLINNSGWDSFMVFSGKDNISNYIAGTDDFKDTLQYRLLKTYDISELERLNVKYIYDFSKIYVSNMNLYAEPARYGYDLSLIKNDADFQNKLMAANPGKLIQVSDNILMLKNSSTRISLSAAEELEGSSATLYFQKVNPTRYKIYIKGLAKDQELNFAENFNSNWKLYLDNVAVGSNQLPIWCKGPDKTASKNIECEQKNEDKTLTDLSYLFAKPINNVSHKLFSGYGNGWTLSPSKLLSMNDGSKVKANPDGSVDLEMTLYFWPQAPFALAIVLSLAAILSTIGFLVYSKFRTKK